jgi:hypothetical protein
VGEKWRVQIILNLCCNILEGRGMEDTKYLLTQFGSSPILTEGYGGKKRCVLDILNAPTKMSLHKM